MDEQQVVKWLGEARFRPYLNICDGDHVRAVCLYNWNIEISAAFMEVLHHIEVLFRNAIDNQFPPTTDLCLSISLQNSWLCSSELLTDESRERVNDAIQRLVIEGKKPTRDRVVASLTFGFWRALFGGRYEELWRSHLRFAFPNGSGRRSEVNRLTSKILPFRNRIAHHEAIYDMDLVARHRELLTLVGLVDREAARFIAGRSKVNGLMLEMPCGIGLPAR